VLRLEGLNRRGNLNITKTKTIMKTSSSFAKTLAMAGFVGVAAATAQAQNTISWSMNRWGFTQATGNNGGQPVPNTTAGAPGYVAANWNDAYNESVQNSSSATVNNLWDSSGADSGASITYSCKDLWQIQNSGNPARDTDLSYNKQMLNGYLDSGLAGLNSTIAISSIPYSTYDIIVYFSGDTAGRAGTLNVGSTTYDFTSMGGAAISGGNALFTQATDTTGSNPTAADYAIFSGLTGSSETITFTASVDGAGGIAAFQIVSVPEPGSMALAIMGGLGVLLMKRRFKKS
jgi:hypothetical protein